VAHYSPSLRLGVRGGGASAVHFTVYILYRSVVVDLFKMMLKPCLDH